MSNYKVEVFVPGFANSESPLMIFNVKVKHFRNSENGRDVSTMGGHTCIFHADSNMVFSARCRHDEAFSRRKGILMCLQKMFENKCMQEKLARYSYNINQTESSKEHRSIPNVIVAWKFTGSGVKLNLIDKIDLVTSIDLNASYLSFLSAGV